MGEIMNFPSEWDDAREEEKTRKAYEALKKWSLSMDMLRGVLKPDKKSSLEKIKEELEKPRDIEL